MQHHAGSLAAHNMLKSKFLRVFVHVAATKMQLPEFLAVNRVVSKTKLKCPDKDGSDIFTVME